MLLEYNGFKVGKKYRIVNAGWGYGSYALSTVITITELSDRNEFLCKERIEREDGSANNGWHNLNSLDPNEVIEEDKEWYKSLKIGDYVVFNGGYRGNAKPNTIHPVIKTYQKGKAFFYTDTWGPDIEYTKHWRKATPQEAELCKANNNQPTSLDWKPPVKESSVPDLSLYEINEYGCCSECAFYSTSYRCYTANHVDKNPNGWCKLVPHQSYQLKPQIKLSNEPKFKIGDKVKVIGDTSSHKLQNGTKLTIKEVKDNHAYFEETCMAAYFRDLELYSKSISNKPIFDTSTAVIIENEEQWKFIHDFYNLPILQYWTRIGEVATRHLRDGIKFTTEANNNWWGIDSRTNKTLTFQQWWSNNQIKIIPIPSWAYGKFDYGFVNLITGKFTSLKPKDKTKTSSPKILKSKNVTKFKPLIINYKSKNN